MPYGRVQLRAGAQHVEGLTEVAALDQQADQPEDSAAERDIEPEPICPPPLSWRGQDKRRTLI